MFKYWSIKKYGSKLLLQLEKRYGKAPHYSAHQIRATVYQCDFNAKYLPLGYLLYLDRPIIASVLKQEFPQLNVAQYKQEILKVLSGRSCQNFFAILKH